ncbi:MAG TPA: hypothetical protein VFV92_01010 [Candidatus Bathyarchaeia archaeon]|nr:hypothetical protein [Candidatus Bathyarchaeia archaeon]
MEQGKQGGKTLSYHTPQGPTDQMKSGPGLHGDKQGCGDEGFKGSGPGGKVGLGGDTHKMGTQGTH